MRLFQEIKQPLDPLLLYLTNTNHRDLHITYSAEYVCVIFMFGKPKSKILIFCGEENQYFKPHFRSKFLDGAFLQKVKLLLLFRMFD